MPGRLTLSSAHCMLRGPDPHPISAPLPYLGIFLIMGLNTSSRFYVPMQRTFKKFLYIQNRMVIILLERSLPSGPPDQQAEVDRALGKAHAVMSRVLSHSGFRASLSTDV